MVDMVDINTNDFDITKYSIILLRGNTMVVTKQLLKSSNVPDSSSITIYSENYNKKNKNLTQEEKYNIMFPGVLSPLQKKLKS